ncbi:hypothetical protein IFM89_024830 [Coptis chinensis]|uniref:Xylanase inhibitor C-terminal domain-containing protein n=1 Tax=Coptis chinensis TaxID=261450 RepID=A0A835LNE6_9MAGN|nr:hypothetical protein IFM89_024830 [Coptis chinensis]
MTIKQLEDQVAVPTTKIDEISTTPSSPDKPWRSTEITPDQRERFLKRLQELAKISGDNYFSGIFYASNVYQVCLAFAGNMDAEETAVIGNWQQQTVEVVYDVAGGKLGFAYGGCN